MNNFDNIFDNLYPLRPLFPFVQSVLPTVFDDSLSYLETLGKVVKALNDTESNVNTLEQAVRAFADDLSAFENLVIYPVNMTFDQNTGIYTADKTYADIDAALLEGKTPVLHVLDRDGRNYYTAQLAKANNVFYWTTPLFYENGKYVFFRAFISNSGVSGVITSPIDEGTVIVNYTSVVGSSTPIVDKTFEQISAALDDKAPIYLFVDNAYWIPLSRAIRAGNDVDGYHYISAEFIYTIPVSATGGNNLGVGVYSVNSSDVWSVNRYAFPDTNRVNTLIDNKIAEHGGADSAVLYTVQMLTDAQKSQARANIGAGKSTVSYNENNGVLTVINDGVPVAYYVPNDTVRYTAQTLTDAQKAQARANIGADSDIIRIYMDTNDSKVKYVSDDAEITSTEIKQLTEAGKIVRLENRNGTEIYTLQGFFYPLGVLAFAIFDSDTASVIVAGYHYEKTSHIDISYVTAPNSSNPYTSLMYLGDVDNEPNYTWVKHPFVTPEMFGAVGDGINDDTTAIQNAVDSGYDVIFGYGKTYKCGTINVTKNININCRWAQFVCTGEKLFYCHGAVTDSISGSDYVANKLYALPSGDNYTGMGMLKSPDVVNPERSYYYGGFVSLFADGITLETCPVGFTNVTIDKISPITCSIQNLGFVSHPSNPDYNYSIWCEYGLNCEFNNIKHHGEKYEVVRIYKSYGCTVKNADINANYTGSVANYYAIGVADSTKTTVENSTVYSAWWHSVSTGGNYCVLDTLIKDCELHTTVGAESYNDHGNTYRTRIENSVADSCSVGAGGVVIDTTITANHGSNSSSYNSYIRFHVTPISGINKFRAENIKFETGGFSLGNEGIQIHASAQEGNHTYYLDEVTINHVRTSAVKTMVQFSISDSSVIALEVNGGITIRDFQGSFIPSSASDAKTTFGNKSYLSVEDCLVRDSSSPSRGVTQIGSSGLKMPPYVYIRNSLLYRIAGIIANLTMSDVKITNNSVGNLSITGEGYFINVNGNLKVDDIIAFQYAEFSRCTIGGVRWALAVVNSTSATIGKKYATYGADGLVWNNMSV